MGWFWFKHLPYSITSAPEIFQRLMITLLKDLVVMDDILVHGSNKEEHDCRLDKVLWTIKASGLRLNREKCHFGQTKLQLFGHIISANGVKPDTSKMEAITKLASSGNVEHVRQMQGLINFVWKFLPGLSTMLHPLTGLLRKEPAWVWGKPQETACRKAKAALAAATALPYYDTGLWDGGFHWSWSATMARSSHQPSSRILKRKIDSPTLSPAPIIHMVK